MIPNDLHYEFPSAAYLLFGALGILFLFWGLYLYRSRILKRFAPENVLNEILVARSRYNFWAKVIALSCAWILAALALMEPVGNGHYPLESGKTPGDRSKGREKEAIVKRKAHDVIFLVDASASMEVTDTRIKVSRLDYAKEIGDQIMSRLKGESVALYAFTSDTTKLSPLTMDYIFVRLMLRHLDINEGDIAGTNVIEAIADMRDEYFPVVTPKLKTLIVLTDGGDTQLYGMKGAERENQIKATLAILNNAEENQLRVITIGMGTEQGTEIPGFSYEGKPVVSELDDDLLKRISEKGRGQYYFANDWTAMDLAEEIVQKIEQQGTPLEEFKVRSGAKKAKGGEDLVYDLFFQVPLGIAMLFLAFVLFFPDARLRKEVIASLMILLSVNAYAQEEVALIRQAEAYYEAKEYDHARELFEKLEGEKLQPWQKARLSYNIGTIYLEKGSWEKAASEYSEIPYSPKNAPLLGRALKTNTAIMQFRQGMQLVRKDALVLEDYSKSFYLFREALKNTKEAQNAECLLEEKMGRAACRKAEDLMELYSALKKELALITRKYGEAKIADSNVKEGIPFLLSGVKLALSHLEFLGDKNLDGTLKGKYLKLFIRDIESWLSLWEAQLSKLGDLEEAFDHYRDGVNQMKKEQFDESRLAFLSSEASLSELMHRLWGLDPFIELLRKLLTGYQRALDQVPIQIPTLYQIQTEQLKVREVAETNKISLEKFDVAGDYLKKSIDFARQGKTVQVRFFLEEARQWLRRLLRLKPETAEAPVETLENAIEEQTHALNLHRLKQEIIEKGEDLETMNQKAQEFTLSTAAPFFEEVLAKEIKEFPVRCQCLPWNKVVPLFDKGEQAAGRAMGLLKQQKKPLAAMAMQEEALRYWREALDKLKHPEEDEKKPPEQKQESPQEKQPQPQPEEKTSMKEVLQLLQTMDQEDRRPEPQGITPKQGLRPW